MDWARAKTILIIALLITDLLLIFTYGGFNFKAESFKDSRALSEFLAQKDIYVDEKQIPLKHSNMPVLYLHSEEPGDAESRITEALKGPDFVMTGEDYKKTADAFLKAAGLDYDTATFEGIETSGEYTKVVYKNIFHNVKVEKSYIICTFKDGVLVDCDHYWLKAERFHNKKQETISAASALLLFMSEARDEGHKDIQIDSIEMVYWLDESVSVGTPVLEDTALPAWKISYNGGYAAYIDAYEHQ